MADEDEQKLSIDTSQYEEAINRVIDINNKLAESAKRAFSGLAVTVDQSGNVVKRVLTEYDDAFTKTTTTATKNAKGIETFTQTIKTSIPVLTSATDITRQYAIQLSKLAEASSKNIQAPSAARLTRLDSREIATVNQAIKQLQENINKTDLSAGELRDDLIKLNKAPLFGANVSKELAPFQKIKETLTGVIGGDKFKKDVIDYVTGIEQVGAARAKILKTDPTNAARNLLSPSQLSIGSNAEILAVNKANEAKSKELERLLFANVSQPDIEKAFVQLGKGQVSQVKPELQNLISLELKLKDTIEAVGDEALRTARKQQTGIDKAALITRQQNIDEFKQNYAKLKSSTIQSNVPQAFSDVQKAFGPVPAIADEKQTQQISNKYGRIAQLIAEGKVNLTQLSEQLDIVNNKKVLAPDADENVKKLNREVTSLITQLQNLIDKEKSAASATSQKQTVQQAIPGLSKTVQANLEQTVGPFPLQIANVSQVQKFGSTIGQISEILARGKATFADYIQQLDIINTKKVVPAHANEDINELRRLITIAVNDINNLTEKENAALNRALSLAQTSAQTKANNAQTAAKAQQLAQGAQTVFPQLQADISNKKIGFGQLNEAANITDVQRISVAYAEMSRIIASGSVTYQQFLNQLDIVKNKKIVPPDANPDINALRANLSQLGSAFEVANVRANAYTRIVLTLTGVLRLMIGQAIHASIARLISGFTEATKVAGEFGTKIALIQTITQDQPASINAWTESLTRLSNQLGRPIVEVAGAAYDSLSNQVTKSKEETEAFLTVAGNFARTVGATLPESVNLFSTAIKGLNLNIGEAEKIASVFFGGIDYGRITAQGFNATLGRTVPLARDLKISLEELVAAQAALTQVGFGPEEAGTRLTNLLLGLEKPSAELTKFFKSFGADTGRGFVQAVGGFEGVIKALSEGSKSGAVNIEQLFPELRKLQAAFGLVNDSGKTFAQIFKDISAGIERYKAAQKITEDTFAFKFSKEINELQNTFVKFGSQFQQVFVNISDFIGGAATRFSQLLIVIKDGVAVVANFYAASFLIGKISAVIASVTFAFGELKAAIELGSLAALSFNSTISLTAGQIGGIGAAAFVATLALLKYRDAYKQSILDANAKQTQLEFKIDVDSFKTSIHKITEAISNETQRWTSIYAQISGRLTVILTTELERQKEALKDVGKTTENVFKSVTQILETGIHNLESAARKASDVANDTAKTIEEIQRSSHDKEIEFQRDLAKAQNEGGGTGRNEEVIVLNEIIRLQKIAGEHSKEEAIDPTKIGQAKKDIEDAIRLLDSLKSGYIEAATKKHNIEFTASVTTKDTGIQGIIQSQLDSLRQLQTGKVIAPPQDESNTFETENNQNNQLYGNIYTWKQKINELTQQLIDIENKEHDAQLKNSINLQEIARQRKVELDAAIEAQKKFSEFSLLDKTTGKIRTPNLVEGDKPDQDQFIRDELAKAQKLQKDAEDKLKNVYNNVLKDPQAGLKSRLDLQDIGRKQLEELHKAQLNQGESQLNVGKTGQKIKDEEDLLRKQKEVTEDAQQRYKATEENATKIKESIGAAQKEAKDLIDTLSKNASLPGIEKLLDQLKDFNKDPSKFVDKAPELLKQLQDLYNQSKKEAPNLSSAANQLIDGMINRLKGGEGLPLTNKPGDQFVPLPEGTKTQGSITTRFGGEQVQTSQALTNLEQLIKGIASLQPQLEQQQNAHQNAEQTINSLGAGLDKLPEGLRSTTGAFNEFSKSLKGRTSDIDQVLKAFTSVIQSAISRLNTSINTEKTTPTTNPQAQNQVQSLSNISQAAPQEDPYAGITNYLDSLPDINPIQNAKGGLVNYYDKGGITAFKPKGIDTIPAMLAPNEFVVSQKGTAKFLKELQLMNKGIDPFSSNTSYFAEGGLASSKSTRKLVNELLNKVNPLTQAPYHSETNILKSIHPISNDPIISQKGTKRFVNELLNVNTEPKAPVDLEQNLLKYLKPATEITSKPIDMKGLIKKFNQNTNNENVSLQATYSSKGGVVKSFIPQMYSSSRPSVPKYYSQGGIVGDTTNIGDVNVHMNESSKNPNLGTVIGNQIRRELRRGTIKPF